MPELRELEFQRLQLVQWRDSKLATPGWDPLLRNISLDATEAEREMTDSPRLKKGFVDSIDNAMDTMRGSKSVQQPVFPSMFGSLKALQDRRLRLTGIESSGRSIILVFGDIICQIQPLTHTNVQVYDMENWHAVYRTSHLPLVGKYAETKMRTFKCAIAFEIGEDVISFNTLDFLFQVTWARTSERNDPVKGLSHDDFSILDNWKQFLALWSSLLEKKVTARTKSKGLNGLLRNWLTEPKNTMYNPGVGLPPDLSLGDLLRSPSRLCRYLFALYQFLFDARHRIWIELVRACIHNNILAPRTKQRLRYPNYLWVWAKDTLRTTDRQYAAVLAYNTVGTSGVHLDSLDICETAFLKDACRNAPELVSVIFGDLSGSPSSPELEDIPAWSENPLLLTFRRMHATGLLNPTKACLNISQFTPLFLPASELRKRELPTILYGSGASDDKIWSVLIAKRGKNFTVLVGNDRTSRIFRLEVLFTKDVAIGPLEYCGVGMIIKMKGGNGYYVYPSRGAVLTGKVPYSSALKATTQAIVKVKEFRDSISGTSKAALTKAEKAVRARARSAFRMVYPVAWITGSLVQAQKALTSTTIAIASTAAASPIAAATVTASSSTGVLTLPVKRRRTQAEMLKDECGVTEGSGRGKRRKTEVPSGAYDMSSHFVDVSQTQPLQSLGNICTLLQSDNWPQRSAYFSTLIATRRTYYTFLRRFRHTIFDRSTSILTPPRYRADHVARLPALRRHVAQYRVNQFVAGVPPYVQDCGTQSPPLPLQLTEVDTAVVTSSPEEPRSRRQIELRWRPRNTAARTLTPERSPDLEIPPYMSPQHVTSPSGLQKLPESENTVRSTIADGLVSLSYLFEYAKVQGQAEFAMPQAELFAADTAAASPPRRQIEYPFSSSSRYRQNRAMRLRCPLRTDQLSPILNSKLVDVPSPETVASITVTSPDQVPVELFVPTSPVPHELVKSDGSAPIADTSEAIQQARVKSKLESVVTVQEEEHRASGCLSRIRQDP
ncbi:hypothetical protein PENSPDRAFT_665021 [Peniophora sp. CONT]|nr:hypothetical protein PENSPDRAFT_665021 [Peniophora sp. CONT]